MKELEELSLRHRNNYKTEVLKFYKYIEGLDDLNHLKHLIGFHLAPSINKIKVGSLINLKNSKKDLAITWSTYKDEIAKFFNIDFIELKNNDDALLLYFYNADKLISRVNNRQISSYLTTIGYEKNENINYYLKKLQENCKCSIPSEVGIFLDYPLSDVIDFESNLKECKYSGYWKCYNDVKGAKNMCLLYDLTKMNYINKIMN